MVRRMTTPSTTPSDLPEPRSTTDTEATATPDLEKAQTSAAETVTDAPAAEATSADPAAAASAAAAAVAASVRAGSPAEAAEGDEDLAPGDRLGGPWQPRPHSTLSPEEKDPEELTDEELEDLASGVAGGLSKGIVGGAAAIVAAALGLASIGGTWLGQLLYQRSELIGSIKSNGATDNSKVLKAEYLDPWHRISEVNGIFAIAAFVVGVLVLVFGRFVAYKEMPNWIKAVSWAAVALGLIGGLIAGAMYFDWFTSHISIPASTSSSTTG